MKINLKQPLLRANAVIARPVTLCALLFSILALSGASNTASSSPAAGTSTGATRPQQQTLQLHVDPDLSGATTSPTASTEATEGTAAASAASQPAANPAAAPQTTAGTPDVPTPAPNTQLPDPYNSDPTDPTPTPSPQPVCGGCGTFPRGSKMMCPMVCME